MPKRSRNFDLVVGVALLAMALSLTSYFAGPVKALWLIYACVLCIVVPWLWANSLGYIAVLLVPGVLLQYLHPKALRASVKALPSEVSSVDSNA
jgi:hypothetical protein